MEEGKERREVKKMVNESRMEVGSRKLSALVVCLTYSNGAWRDDGSRPGGTVNELHN